MMVFDGFVRDCLFCILQILPGNINTFEAEARNISPPIIAQKIRIIPYSTHPRIICLRVELYGCLWKGELQWYLFCNQVGFTWCIYLWCIYQVYW